MDLNLMDLSNFKKLSSFDIKTNDANTHVVRNAYDHGLIIIVETNDKEKQVRLHSNFEWKNVNGKWQPDLTKRNVNFHDSQPSD